MQYNVDGRVASEFMDIFDWNEPHTVWRTKDCDCHCPANIYFKASMLSVYINNRDSWLIQTHTAH
jgi:hypothetical protein